MLRLQRCASLRPMPRLSRHLMLAAMLLLASASIAKAHDQQRTEGQELQQQPTRVVATFRVSHGHAKKVKHGLAVRIEDFSAGAAEKAWGGTLSRTKRLEQRTVRYLWDWRRDSKGEQRRAVLTLDGGDKVTLKVRHPRIEDGDLLFRARRATPTALPQTFGTANLRVAGNWYPIVARLSAKPTDQGGYSCAEDKWRTGPFSCDGSGEAKNTEPWNSCPGLGCNWNSTDGGRVFQMTGYQEVGVFCPLCNATNTRYVRRTAALNGTSAGWGGRQVTINSSSYYSSNSGSGWGSCTKRPVSGTDDSLVGKPGGPLRTDLKFVGGIFQYPWYILTATGYLSEPFPPPESC